MGAATEYLFSHHSDLQSSGSRRTGAIDFSLVTPPAEEPLTVPQAKANLRIRLENARHDELLTRIIPQARQWVELATGQMFIAQTWRQVHNSSGSLLGGGGVMPEAVCLYLEKVRSVSSVKYYPTMDSTSLTTVSASTYFLTGQNVVPRTTWPVSRGIGGYEIEYVVGHGSDRADLVANSYANPLVRALDVCVAYLFENPGDGTQFESGGGGRTRVRSLPPEALDIMATYERFEL